MKRSIVLVGCALVVAGAAAFWFVSRGRGTDAAAPLTVEERAALVSAARALERGSQPITDGMDPVQAVRFRDVLADVERGRFGEPVVSPMSIVDIAASRYSRARIAATSEARRMGVDHVPVPDDVLDAVVVLVRGFDAGDLYAAFAPQIAKQHEI